MLEESKKTAVIRESTSKSPEGKERKRKGIAYASKPYLQSNLAGELFGPGEVGALLVIQSWWMGRLPLWPSELTGRHWHLESA